MAEDFAQITRRPALINVHSSAGLGNAVDTPIEGACPRSRRWGACPPRGHGMPMHARSSPWNPPRSVNRLAPSRGGLSKHDPPLRPRLLDLRQRGDCTCGRTSGLSIKPFVTHSSRHTARTPTSGANSLAVALPERLLSHDPPDQPTNLRADGCERDRRESSSPSPDPAASRPPADRPPRQTGSPHQ